MGLLTLRQCHQPGGSAIDASWEWVQCLKPPPISCVTSNAFSTFLVTIWDTTSTHLRSPMVPPRKLGLGYELCKDKFARSGLTQQPSDLIRPPRITECPVQMEAEMMNSMELMHNLPDRKGALLAIELKILRTHVRNDLRLPGHANRIDADRWRPMIMSF